MDRYHAASSRESPMSRHLGGPSASGAGVGAVLKQGWMEKRGQGPLGFAWRRRWFVLDSRRVAYFKSPESTAAQGFISMHRARVSLVDGPAGQKDRFELRLESLCDDRIFKLACATAEEQREWHEALENAVLACLAQVGRILIFSQCSLLSELCAQSFFTSQFVSRVYLRSKRHLTLKQLY